MTAAEGLIVAVIAAVVMIPIILAATVRRRQKQGRWKGEFTPGYDPTINSWASRINEPPPPAPDQSEVRDRRE